MYIDKWTSGYKVDVCDWYDGKSIYFCVKYYRPGASMERPPALERSVLISREDYQKVLYYTDSIALAIMGDSEKLMGKSALPLLSEYRNGVQTVRDGVSIEEAAE